MTRLGSAPYVNGGAGTVTSELQLASFTTACVSGRKYRGMISGVLTIVTGSSGSFIGRYASGGSVTTSSTEFMQLQFQGNGGSEDKARIVEFASPGTGTFTFGLFVRRESGSGNVTVSNNANQPDILTVDDVGI